jgi:hypothetical protein
MITYDSLNSNKEYYAVYVPIHDDVPHLLVPLKVKFRGFYSDTFHNNCKYLRVRSSMRTTEYKCELEDNAFIRINMKPRNMLQLTAYQCSWLPKGTLYVTEDKQLLTKYIRDFYRIECHRGRMTARGTYQKVMNTLKQLK